jgi:hypothetical protein
MPKLIAKSDPEIGHENEPLQMRQMRFSAKLQR